MTNRTSKAVYNLDGIDVHPTDGCSLGAYRANAAAVNGATT